MSVYLSPELLQKIFDHIHEDDFNTLHSIILVNRDWCRSSIMLLWKKPFNEEIFLLNRHKILPIILSFLDDERKDYLKITDERLEIPTNVLFNYLSFIKELHYEPIMRFIDLWIKEKENLRPILDFYYFFNHEKEYVAKFKVYDLNYNVSIPGKLYKPHERVAFFDAIYHVISNDNELKSFVSDELMDTRFIPFYQAIISSNPTFLDRLENLEFYYDGRFSGILEELAKISHNIKSINIKFCNDLNTKGLIQLIKSQNNLEHMSFDRFEGENLPEILKALITQAHSLRSFKLWKCEIDNNHNNCLEFLKEHRKLEELEFGYIECYDVYDVKHAQDFPHLKRLRFYDSDDGMINCSIFFSLIINIGKYLNELIFLVDLQRYPNNTMKVITDSCQNLVSLSIIIQSHEELDELIKYFDRFQKLEILKICKRNVLSMKVRGYWKNVLKISF